MALEGVGMAERERLGSRTQASARGEARATRAAGARVLAIILSWIGSRLCVCVV
jgi:hypothetical protein